MWNLKCNTNESIYKQKYTDRHRKQTYGYQRGKGERGKGRVGVWGLTGANYNT